MLFSLSFYTLLLTAWLKPAALDKDFIMGRFVPENHPQFVKVNPSLTDGKTLYLQKQTHDAFEKMAAAAKKDGIRLVIISATRSFDRQKQIWERKWAALPSQLSDVDKAKKILTYSAMPSSSRHHWGTDIDLNDLNNAFFEQGQGQKVYMWLVKNAAQYGFGQPYTAGRPHGYYEEKWHWSYLPLAQKYTEWAKNNLKDSDITGFKGAHTAGDIHIIKHYVLGINPSCL